MKKNNGILKGFGALGKSIKSKVKFNFLKNYVFSCLTAKKKKKMNKNRRFQMRRKNSK